MHLSTTGMMVGVPFSIGGFSWRCMSPVTPGNALGGAILVGLVCSDTYGGRVRQSIGGRMGWLMGMRRFGQDSKQKVLTEQLSQHPLLQTHSQAATASPFLATL